MLAHAACVLRRFARRTRSSSPYRNPCSDATGGFLARLFLVPLLIVTHLEQYDYAGATAIAVVMLVISFGLLMLINLLQWWSGKRLARI